MMNYRNLVVLLISTLFALWSFGCGADEGERMPEDSDAEQQNDDDGDESTDCESGSEPVCGEDGNTYGNDCEAEQAGVDVAYDGECTEDVCDCSDERDPVCGEDGETYDNQCLAACAGVNVDYDGECSDDDDGGDIGCPDVWDPVCGEDANTYGNDCEAEQAGVDVEHDGECSDDDDGNLGGGDSGCVCPMVYDPVCGEDGNTYGNDCEADCAGVEVDYQGECNGLD